MEKRPTEPADTKDTTDPTGAFIGSLYPPGIFLRELVRDRVRHVQLYKEGMIQDREISFRIRALEIYIRNSSSGASVDRSVREAALGFLAEIYIRDVLNEMFQDSEFIAVLAGNRFKIGDILILQRVGLNSYLPRLLIDTTLQSVPKKGDKYRIEPNFGLAVLGLNLHNFRIDAILDEEAVSLSFTNFMDRVLSREIANGTHLSTSIFSRVIYPQKLLDGLSAKLVNSVFNFRQWRARNIGLKSADLGEIGLQLTFRQLGKFEL